MTVTASTIATPPADIRVIQSSGTGMPVVLVHGSGASKAVFARQFESPLAQTNRLVAMDLPGHGESGNARDPANDYTIKGFAATVGAVLDRLEIERAVVFGWSLGGHIAIDLMSWHPAVAGLMLTGTPPIQRGPLGLLRGFQLSRATFLVSKPQFTDDEAARFLKACFGDTGTPEFLESIKRADGRARKIVFNGMMRGDGVDQRRAVEHAAVPIAMVNGSKEPLVRLSYVNDLSYGTLWSGHCQVIEGAGHAPFWESPDKFNALLTSFIGDVAAVETLHSAQARPAIARAS